jgi:3-hydroxy acid dehydrogenase / malonic semialdehyde reductase
MGQLKDKIILITGASSGIGEACAKQFAAQGAKLILAARRKERLEALAEKLTLNHQVSIHLLQLDVRDKAQVQQAIATLPSDWQAIDVLVNNAGLALSTDKMQDAKVENWEVMIDTNIKGLLYITNAILAGMVQRNRGHIINIGSIAGHEYYPAGNVYSATKHAVKAITKSLKIDLLGTDIRVTEIAPGAVETEFSEIRWNDKERAKNFYKDFKPLIADDIADIIVYCANAPAHVNIAEIIVTPVAQSSANHLHKK